MNSIHDMRMLDIYVSLQFPITALREIRILQLLKHENVVNLIEICRTKATKNNKYKSIFYLVFDFCEHDLVSWLRIFVLLMFIDMLFYFRLGYCPMLM